MATIDSGGGNNSYSNGNNSYYSGGGNNSYSNGNNSYYSGGGNNSYSNGNNSHYSGGGNNSYYSGDGDYISDEYHGTDDDSYEFLDVFSSFLRGYMMII